MPDTTQGTYLDLYLLPVPQADLEDYRRQATTFGTVAVELGALSYREVVQEDPGEGFAVEEATVLTAAIAEFASRAHRDEVMERVMADPRVTALLESGSPADMTQMRYGGFAPFVTV